MTAKETSKINQHYSLSPDDQYIFDQMADAVENIDKSIMALGGAQNTWMPESSISYDRFKTMLLHQAKTYDSSITRDQINAVLRAYSECVKAVIAENTSVDLNWATVGGETRKPRLITGVLATRQKAQGEPVFSTAISGKPYCTFPRKLQDGSSFMTADEYYNQPILKFTTEARLYRKLSHINELPEFAGYSEEQINNITAKADKQYFATLTKSEVAKTRKRIKDINFPEQCPFIVICSKKYALNCWKPLRAIYTTTQHVSANVTVQKIYRLGNQQPSLSLRERFNDYPF